MAQVTKKRRLVNPAKRRRRLTAKQIKYFGTKRQRAALKTKHRRRRIPPVMKRRKRPVVAPKRHAVRRRTSPLENVGEIITVGLGAVNPGRRTSMARRARKGRRRATVRRRTKRAAQPKWLKRLMTSKRHRRRANPGRRRRFNVARRRHVRRNPGWLTGTAGKVVGVLGGAAATKLVVDRLPASMQTGVIGYVSTAAVSALLGWGVGKFGKNVALGQNMALGGFTYLGLRILSDLVPSLAGLSPFGLKGIVPSSFYVPQVPKAGSMNQFLTPPAVSAALGGAQSMSGFRGMSGRRLARLA